MTVNKYNFFNEIKIQLDFNLNIVNTAAINYSSCIINQINLYIFIVLLIFY